MEHIPIMTETQILIDLVCPYRPLEPGLLPHDAMHVLGENDMAP